MTRLLLVVLLTAICSNCSPQVNATAVLYDETFFTPATDTPLQSYKDSIILQVAGKRAPLALQWTAARKQGCLYVQQLQVRRTGGDASVEVANVRVGHVECGMDSFGNDGKDTVRSERLVITYRLSTRVGVKTYDVEDNRSITGDGRVGK